MRRLVLVLALASLAADGIAGNITEDISGVLATAGEPVRVATLLPYVADALEEIHGPARVVASVRRTVSQAPAVYDNVWWHNALFHGKAEECVVIHFHHESTHDTRFGGFEEVP